MKRKHIAIDLDDTLIYRVGSMEWEIDETAKLYLRRIQDEFNFKFSLITARPRDSLREVQNIVRIIESQLGVTFKNIVCTDFNMKGAYCDELGCSVIIDDNESFMSDCSRQMPPVTAILFGQSNNGSPDGYIGCPTWKEVYLYFRYQNQ